MPPPPPVTSSTSTDGDGDDEYDPSAEALVNDFDDERTLDEEEDMQEDDAQDEINDLQKDAEMPLDELLAYYQYVQSGGAASSADASSSFDDDDDDEDDDSKINNSNSNNGNSINDHDGNDEDDDDDDDDEDADYDEDDDDYEDDDGPGAGWRRLIKVGPEHQAHIPDELSHYGDVPAYENPDLLMWTRGGMSDEQLEDYLRAASAITRAALTAPAVMVPAWTAPASVPDHHPIVTDSMGVYVSTGSETQTSSTSSSAGDSSDTVPFHDDLYMTQSRKQQRAYHHQQQQLHQQQQHDDITLATVLTTTDDVQSQAPVMVTPSNVHHQHQHTHHHPNTNNINNFQHYQIDNYQSGDSSTTTTGTTTNNGSGAFVADEEQLLYLLLQCNHNTEEALRRRSLDPFKYYVYEPMSPWSDEECLRFEKGLRMYGKNFHAVTHNEVTTRKISEVIAFYYIWKKSERHDMYVNQYNAARAAEYACGRKRTSGGHAADTTIDYMDKFVDRNNEMLSSCSTLSSSGQPQQQHVDSSATSSSGSTSHNKFATGGVSL